MYFNFISFEPLILHSIYWFPVTVVEDLALPTILITFRENISLLSQDSVILWLCFLVQLCFLKLIIASLMLGVFVCCFWKHLLLNLPTRPSTAWFSIMSHHSGKLSGFFFFFLLFNLEISFLLPFCPHASVCTGRLVGLWLSCHPRSFFCCHPRNSLHFSPVLDLCFLGFLVFFLDMLSYFGRGTSSSSCLRKDT